MQSELTAEVIALTGIRQGKSHHPGAHKGCHERSDQGLNYHCLGWDKKIPHSFGLYRQLEIMIRNITLYLNYLNLVIPHGLHV